MTFDVNEARAIIEAAIKRGAIRGPGGAAISGAKAQAPGDEEKRLVLPDWLQNEIKAPTSGDRPATPAWRSE